jgi:branched-chain amino acid transport system substrate-binding protein
MDLNRVHRYAVVAAWLAFVGVAQANIKIGMVLPLSGPLAGTGNDIAQGTQAAVDAVNKAGGIKGQRIELMIEDDKFDAALTESLAQNLVKTKGVSALISCFGTVNCLAVAKVAQGLGVPLLGPIAGAEALRDANLSKVYSVRANAGEEVGVLLKYLSAIQQNKAAVIVQDDGFGKAYANSLQRVAEQYNFKPSVQLSFDPKKPDYAALAKRVMAGDPSPSVLLIANTLHSVGIIKALNDAKYYGQVLNLAGQANGGFVKGLANSTQLAVFATVTPSPFAVNSSAAEAYRSSLQQSFGKESVSYIGFEAFLNAQLLAAALKRSTSFSSTGIDLALSQLNKVRVYELSYSFAGKARQAASFTDLAVLSQGTFKH